MKSIVSSSKISWYSLIRAIESKNGGGIRKVRCAQGNKGKSGGIRVIYYWVTEDDQIFFLVAYPKSLKDNLTDKETSILRQLVKEQFHG